MSLTAEQIEARTGCAGIELLGDASRARLHIGIDEYHADRNAVNKTLLDYVNRSPAHARAYLDGLIVTSSAVFDLGSAAHEMILEADSVGSRFLHPGERLDRRYKRDKEIWAELEQRAREERKTLLTFDDWRAALQIRDAVYAHKTARSILSRGEPEQTFVWRDPATGELCKCRIDWLRENFLTDIKTAVDASPEAFARSCINYRYDVQDAHYTSGVDDPGVGFVFVVVEKAPPFAVAVYADYDAMRRLGRQKRDRNLETYAECRRTGDWPGYPNEVQPLQLPAWAMKELRE